MSSNSVSPHRREAVVLFLVRNTVPIARDLNVIRQHEAAIGDGAPPPRSRSGPLRTKGWTWSRRAALRWPDLSTYTDRKRLAQRAAKSRAAAAVASPCA